MFSSALKPQQARAVRAGIEGVPSARFAAEFDRNKVVNLEGTIVKDENG